MPNFLFTPSIVAAAHLDKNNGDSQCGKVYLLDHDHVVRLQTKGLAPEGYCGVSVFTPSEVNNQTCDAICVTIKSASLDVCDVKLKFSGHKFGAAGDLVKVGRRMTIILNMK